VNIARMGSCRLRSLGLACAAWVALANLTTAAGAELNASLASLFELGTTATPSAFTAAHSRFERLQHSRSDDRRIDYAYGVVLIGQHKYADALPLISRYLETGRGEPHAYCAKIWALLQMRRYADVLDESVELAGRFPKDLNSPPLAKYHEAAEFLGAAFGYLELVRTGALDPARRLEGKNRVLARLGSAYTKAFDQGRAAVAAQMAEFQAQREADQKGVAAKAEGRKQQTKTALDKDRERILSEKETLQASAEQLRDAQRELNQLQQELSSLNVDRSQVAAQIAWTQANIQQLLAPIVYDQTQIGRAHV
jgi:hypothetical protein